MSSNNKNIIIRLLVDEATAKAIRAKADSHFNGNISACIRCATLQYNEENKPKPSPRINALTYLAECHSKHRVGAVFTFGAEPLKERNIIVFDDFVTTGATMISMKNLLQPLGYNLVFFTGINNKA